MQLEDKIALVTGAGRGMGRAISLQLAEAGCNVAVSDIDASTAEDTAVAVKQLGRESVALPADMGDLQDIDRMFRQAKDAFGRIDVVVNNAGVTKYLDIMDVQEEDWDRIHRVNAKGVFFCMQRAARELIDQGQGGRIINIASIAGKGYAGTSNAAYAASKGAVISMTNDAKSTGNRGSYLLRLASIWLTRPSTQRRTNSGRERSIRLAQRAARANREFGTLVVRVFVGFLAMAFRIAGRWRFYARGGSVLGRP